MSKIYLKGLRIFAYHGVNPEEKANGQWFELDIMVEADTSKAELSDEVDDTVSYSALRKTVDRAFTAQSYNLIERAAHVLCETVLKAYRMVEAVTIRVKKPEAPMQAEFLYAGVEIKKRRGNE